MDNRKGEVCLEENGRTIFMADEILKRAGHTLNAGDRVEYVDGNKLNCQRHNLRILRGDRN